MSPPPVLQTPKWFFLSKKYLHFFSLGFCVSFSNSHAHKKMPFLVKLSPLSNPSKLIFCSDTSSTPAVRGRFFPLFKDQFLLDKISPSYITSYCSSILLSLLIASADSDPLSSSFLDPIKPRHLFLLSISSLVSQQSSILHFLTEIHLHFLASHEVLFHSAFELESRSLNNKVTKESIFKILPTAHLQKQKPTSHLPLSSLYAHTHTHQ